LEFPKIAMAGKLRHGTIYGNYSTTGSGGVYAARDEEGWEEVRWRKCVRRR